MIVLEQVRVLFPEVVGRERESSGEILGQNVGGDDR
jgi:hypothetical protein